MFGLFTKKKASSKELQAASAVTKDDAREGADFVCDLTPYDKYGRSDETVAAVTTASPTKVQAKNAVTLQEDLNSHLQTIAGLQQQLSASLAGHAATCQQVSELQEEIAALTAKYDGMRMEVAINRSKTTALQKQLQDSQAAHADLQQHCSSLLAAQERLRQANSKFGRLNRPVSLLNRRLAAEKTAAWRDVNQLQETIAAAAGAAQ